MEYTIGTVQRGSFCCLILKTKNDVHTDLRGRVTLEQKKGNVLITDTFTVKKKYQEGDSIDGIAYDWYFICEHSRTVDRSEEIRANLEQIATDLEKRGENFNPTAAVFDGFDENGRGRSVD